MHGLLLYYKEMHRVMADDGRKQNRIDRTFQKTDVARVTRSLVVKKYGFPMDCIWDRRRFDIFVRIEKKKNQLTNQYYDRED